MVRRILRSVYAVGVNKWGPAPTVDLATHNEIALETGSAATGVTIRLPARGRILGRVTGVFRTL